MEIKRNSLKKFQFRSRLVTTVDIAIRDKALIMTQTGHNHVQTLTKPQSFNLK